MRADLVPLDRDLVARFSTTRGGFTIPADVIDEETGHALTVAFARGLPERGPGVTILTDRTTLKNGDVWVTWRRIKTIIRPA